MSFEAFRATMDEHYRRQTRKARRAEVKRAAKPDLVVCTNHGPKAITRRSMVLEPKATPTFTGRKSRRVRRNQWVPR